MELTIKVFSKITSILLVWSLVIFGQGTDITIIHVNDSHSHLDGTGPRDINLNPSLGSISRAASVLFTLKATDPNPILLHAGDFCVGDFFFNKYFGVPELQILKQIGFDAMTVGNHEFDLGPSTLEMIYSQGFSYGSFPVVSANLDLSGYPSLSSYISPYTIKTVSGVKVGIFGMTVPAPLSNPSPVIINENIPEIAYATVTELQSQGVNVIVCLSHLGYNIDSLVALNVPGINVIVGAHDHFEFNQPKKIVNPAGDTTYIVQAGSYYKNIGELKMNYNNGNVTVNSYQRIPVTSQVPAIQEIENVIDYLKLGIIAQYGDVYNTKLATATIDINPVPDVNDYAWKDSPLGNLVTDAYRYKTGTKIGLTANGLISDKIYHGPLVGADIFRCVAYGYDTVSGLGFNLVKCDIRGGELIKGLEISLSMLGIDNDFMVQVSGLTFKYNPENPVGQRVIIPSVIIGTHPVVIHKKYSITMNEGLLGLLMSMGINVSKIEFAGISEYAALKDYAVMLGNINYSTEGRIAEDTSPANINGKEKDNVNIPGKYELYNNYPNPFNPVTTIKFEVPSDGKVTIKIYNILGQVVATLFDSVVKTGVHEILWDASNMPSGVYLYRMTAGDYTKTHKMVLVK